MLFVLLFACFLCSGYPLEALSLELQLLDSTTRVPGKTLTGVEKRYRTQWIGALHAVMQNVSWHSLYLDTNYESVLLWRLWYDIVAWRHAEMTFLVLRYEMVLCISCTVFRFAEVRRAPGMC